MPVITKTLIGHVDNSSYPSIKVDIDLTLTTPANAPGPVPVIMEFGFVFRPRPTAAPQALQAPPRQQTAAPRPQGPTGPTWQQSSPWHMTGGLR